MKIIGVASQAQHGKSRLAERLAAKLNRQEGFSCWKQLGFADEVKRVFCDSFGVDLEFLEKWKVNPEVPPGFDCPIRRGLQLIGDGFRNIRDTIWIDLVFKHNIPMIIGDVRYPNEFFGIKKRGGLNILIGRPDRVNYDSNSSEALIRPYVLWALENFKDPFTDLREKDLSLGPQGMDCFDLFLRNDSSLEQYYYVIEEMVVPFVNEYQFKE